MPKHRYFDHASTTLISAEVFSAMLPYFSEKFGNPSNLYALGRQSAAAVARATAEIAEVLNCRPDEFVYTGSATEADNLAVLGTARANKIKPAKAPFSSLRREPSLSLGRIIISQIEHKGILAMSEILRKEGFEVVELPVGSDGLIQISDLEKTLTPATILVSVTSADSETGTLQPIAEIAGVIKNFRQKNNSSLPYFHTDASQAAAHIDLNVEKLGVDLMTLSAHKLYGPKGIGGLFIRRGVNINPIIYGGGGLRSGTENVPAIVGFAKALILNEKHRKNDDKQIKKMRDALEKGIFKMIPKVVLNGHQTKRLPNFLNISILDVEGEAMLLMLDELGIMVGTGSACNSLSLEPSSVLSALGNPYEYVHGSLRFSLGRGNTMQDVKYVLKHLPIIVKKLRAISPLELSLGQTKTVSDRRAFVGGQTPHFLKKKK
jgi:cysteine desulfurase